MYEYLLDTNILSDLVRRPQGRAAAQIARAGEQRICTSIIVTAELRYGVAKRGSRRLEMQLATILRRIDALPFEAPADVTYARVRAHLESTDD